MSYLKSLLTIIHYRLAQSAAAVFIATKLRNQCELIIRKRFSVINMDPSKNGEYKVLETILPFCKTYFDVGANKGEWTNFIWINRKEPFECYLYEPGLEAFSYLRRRFKKNNNFKLNNLAVSSSEGILNLYEEANAGGMTSVINGWSSDKTELIQATCTTIDQEIINHKINFIDFLKIDVEGLDLNVIEGAIKAIESQKIGVIQFEYNECWLNTGSTLSKAYKIFLSNHYKVYLIKPSGLSKYDINTYGEFYSLSNFLAVAPKSQSLIKKLL